MREIEFRAIAYGSNKFVYGWLYQTKYESDKYVIRTFPNKDDDYADFIVYKNTIGQDTGLRDKNGVKIFEGDIVKTNEDYRPIYKVEWNEEMGQWRMSNGWDYKSLWFVNNYKVIGNIYQNPDLLTT